MVNIILYNLYNCKKFFFSFNHDFNKNITNLIGFGYDQSIESDILLLDISNNEQYIWTTQFQPTNDKTPLSSSIPSPSSSPLSPSSLPSSEISSNNIPVMIGAIVGSLVGGSLLTIGIFFLYKWNKNKQRQKNAIPTPGNVI